MPQTSEWTQAFEAWNKPDFYDQLLALAGEAEDEESEFFRAGLAYAMSKKFVIYFTQKNFPDLSSKKETVSKIGDCFFFEDYSMPEALFQFFQMWFQKCRLRERCQFP